MRQQRRQWQPTPVLWPGKSHGRRSLVGYSPWGRTRLRDITFTFHFHALEKEMAPHSSVLDWRIPGTAEPGGLPSIGLHRVWHDWSDLAAAGVASEAGLSSIKKHMRKRYPNSTWICILKDWAYVGENSHFRSLELVNLWNIPVWTFSWHKRNGCLDCIKMRKSQKY